MVTNKQALYFHQNCIHASWPNKVSIFHTNTAAYWEQHSHFDGCFHMNCLNSTDWCLSPTCWHVAKWRISSRCVSLNFVGHSVFIGVYVMLYLSVYKKHLTLIHMAVQKTQHAAVFRPHFSIYFGIFFEHNRSTPWLPRLVYMRGTCCMYAQKNSYVKGFLWRWVRAIWIKVKKNAIFCFY